VWPRNGADAVRINQEIGSIGRKEKLDIAAQSVEDLERSRNSKETAIKNKRAGKYRTSGLGKRVRNVFFRC
jgi:hypothetical protein